jgi:hypothetical protein
MNSNTLHVVYEFMAMYVQRIYPDAEWKCKMEQNPNKVFFQMVTPSNIAYVISLVKDGKSLWDQKKRQKNNSEMEGEKKERPLFTCGEGKKRMYAKLRGIWKDWTIFTQRKRIGRMDTINGRNFLHWLMNGRGVSKITRQRRICLGCIGETQMIRTAGKGVKVTSIRDGWMTRKMDIVRISSLRTWIVIMILTRTLEIEYAMKSLGTAYWRTRPNITKRRSVAKREKKRRIMTMNRGTMGRKILVVK